MADLKKQIEAALAGVKFPGFDKDIMSLGLVEEYNVDGGSITVKMGKTSVGEDVKQKIAAEVSAALSPLGLKAEVAFPQDAPKGHGGVGKAPPRPVPPKKAIDGIGTVIPIASGKGGVGKSTASVNIAVALARQGLKVGLLDLDVFGPSIPTMLGLDGRHNANEAGKLLPVEKHGLKIISMGLLMEKGAPLIWRGPMVMKIVKQMLYDVEWGKLDCLVLDLPPGTGDVQLTLIQSIPITGAVIVTTPQDVALADATKAYNMFKQTDTPVIGLIENMSHFICPHCKGESIIFGKGGGQKESGLLKIPLLGRIPLEGKIAQTGDSGEPVALGDDETSKVFGDIAQKIAASIKEKTEKKVEDSLR